MFWERFYDLCTQKGVKPNPVAKELNISSGIISKWKTDGTLPNGENLAKIADYFDVSTDYLLGRTDSPTLAHKKSELVELFDQLTPEDQQKLLTLFYSLKDEHTPAEQ